MSEASFPRRGEIWLTNFEPSVGTEFQKTRPAVIVSNDVANARSPRVTLIPITGTIAQIPVLLIVEPDTKNGLDRRGAIRVPEIATFDKMRLRTRIGQFDASVMRELSAKIKIHLALT